MNDGVDGVTSSIIIHCTDETQLPQSLTDVAQWKGPTLFNFKKQNKRGVTSPPAPSPMTKP